MAEQRADEVRRSVAGWLVPLAAVWPLVLAVLAVRFLLIGLSFEGHSLSYRDQHDKAVDLIWLAVALIGLPGVATVVAALTRRPDVARWLAVVTFVVAVPGVVVAAYGVVGIGHAHPPPAVEYTGCRAYNGGTNTCPGG